MQLVLHSRDLKRSNIAFENTGLLSPSLKKDQLNIKSNCLFLPDKMHKMPNEENDYSFWTKYKKFASTEILMYLIMIIGIGLGIIFLS
jgi:hypothetical protein